MRQLEQEAVRHVLSSALEIEAPIAGCNLLLDSSIAFWLFAFTNSTGRSSTDHPNYSVCGAGVPATPGYCAWNTPEIGLLRVKLPGNALMMKCDP